MSEQVVQAFEKRWKFAINISRVPPKTLEWFKEFAKEEFVDDYGMCLRELVESYKELQMIKEMNRPMSQEVLDKLEQLEVEIADLKQPKEEKKIIKTVNGQILGGKDGSD